PFPFLPRVRRAIQDVIMNHHRHAILAVMIIEFDQLRARVAREFERGQRILRRNRGTAAMPNQQWPFALQKSFSNGLHASQFESFPSRGRGAWQEIWSLQPLKHSIKRKILHLRVLPRYVMNVGLFYEFDYPNFAETPGD